jgi:hypothetical protein
MCRAFAPVLAANGGGAIVNMLSVSSFFTNLIDASLMIVWCESKTPVVHFLPLRSMSACYDAGSRMRSCTQPASGQRMRRAE